MDFHSPALTKIYENLLKESPSSSAFAPLAEIYHLRGERGRAKVLCLEGLRKNPHHSAGYIALAQIYREEGKAQSALKQLVKAARLDAENPQIYKLMGEIYRDLKDLDSALEAFELALFLKPFSRFAKATVQELQKSAAFSGKPNPKPEEAPKTAFHGSPLTMKKLKKLQALLLRVEKRIRSHALAG